MDPPRSAITIRRVEHTRVELLFMGNQRQSDSLGPSGPWWILVGYIRRVICVYLGVGEGKLETDAFSVSRLTSA